MTFHLGGGAGGPGQFMHHLLPAVETWWDDLGAPAMTPELQAALVAGVEAEAAGRSMTDLAQRRDALLNLLVALKRAADVRDEQAEISARLDEALEESFPDSDPIAVRGDDWRGTQKAAASPARGGSYLSRPRTRAAMEGSGQRLDRGLAGVAGRVAQFLFTCSSLVVLGGAVRAGERAGLDLPAVRRHREVGDGGPRPRRSGGT